MVLKSLTEHFIGMLSTRMSGLRLVELDWGQLELTGSVMADPCVLLSIDEVKLKEDAHGFRYDFVLKLKLCWMRYDRLDSTNPRLSTLLDNMDLVDEVVGILDGYESENLVERMGVEYVGLANDQQTNYKQFHKSYECYVVRAKGSGYLARANSVLRVGDGTGSGSLRISGAVKFAT